MSQDLIIFHFITENIDVYVTWTCKHNKKFILESVLIAVGFYIGVTLEYGGALPFIIVAVITVLAMIVSEVVKLLTSMMMMSTMMMRLMTKMMIMTSCSQKVVARVKRPKAQTVQPHGTQHLVFINIIIIIIIITFFIIIIITLLSWISNCQLLSQSQQSTPVTLVAEGFCAVLKLDPNTMPLISGLVGVYHWDQTLVGLRPF